MQLFFKVESSVPQELKTGPLFYTLYANDLTSLFKFAKIKM